ncbi:MAG: hypothetical protein C5B48_12455 [Candidatus Rokuibacteriota bacterium]|nr:MAG: hypothetical protein C5B48_12455 [Candidatus Rokubacteria bacterium]
MPVRATPCLIDPSSSISSRSCARPSPNFTWSSKTTHIFTFGLIRFARRPFAIAFPLVLGDAFRTMPPREPRTADHRPGRPSSTRSMAPTDAETLQRVPYFRILPTAALRRLARDCSPRLLTSGETLFEEGAPCRGLFIIGEGRVEVRQISVRGREQVFHTEEPGATLGEGPLFDGEGYIATAVALEPTRVLFLPRPRLIALCREHPDVALAMLKTMAHRLRNFAGIVGDLAFRPVTERLARYLARVAGRPVEPGTSIELSLTQAQLAARLGTVREIVARAFSDLEDNGIIARDRSRVTIRDPVRLMALARGEEDAILGGTV